MLWRCHSQTQQWIETAETGVAKELWRRALQLGTFESRMARLPGTHWNNCMIQPTDISIPAPKWFGANPGSTGLSSESGGTPPADPPRSRARQTTDHQQ